VISVGRRESKWPAGRTKIMPPIPIMTTTTTKFLTRRKPSGAPTNKPDARPHPQPHRQQGPHRPQPRRACPPAAGVLAVLQVASRLGRLALQARDSIDARRWGPGGRPPPPVRRDRGGAASRHGHGCSRKPPRITPATGSNPSYPFPGTTPRVMIMHRGGEGSTCGPRCPITLQRHPRRHLLAATRSEGF
jgi:hypothetical protein